jgi:regulator of CtrA degradation
MSEYPVELSTAEAPIAFGSFFTQSDTFRALFREGMQLVEETAAYLDGPGRKDAKSLSRHLALAYTTESMRLTTRLMQMASWLLLQRAVNEGELTSEDAATEKNKVRLDGPLTAVSEVTFGELPEGLQNLIRRSIRLQDRVCHLDAALYGPVEAVAHNPVAQGLGRLAAAFGGLPATS